MPRYFLRTTDAQGRAYGEFQWPLEVGAIVEAPDWRDDAKCGGGLHGLENGNGACGLLNWDDDALWWVVSTDDATPVVDLGGKQKFPRFRVEAFGDRKTATDWLVARGCAGVHGATVTGGYGATVTGGYRATVTGGDCATVTGGNRATVTGGDWAILQLTWHDGSRYRIATAYVGEDGIKPGVRYQCHGGKFVDVRMHDDPNAPHELRWLGERLLLLAIAALACAVAAMAVLPVLWRMFNG